MNTMRHEGMVQTVTGLVSAEDLGITLPHEHLLNDLTCAFEEPANQEEKELAYQPISLENLGWIRRNYINNLDNLVYKDEDLAVTEAMLFKHAGGKTIVDNTPWGLTRDPEALSRIASRTGLNIIMGTGYYVKETLPKNIDSQSEEDITNIIVKEIEEGAEGTSIKAGIIGEIGCSWPLDKNEKKSLRAAAFAQKRTGAPLMVHTGRNPKSPKEVVETIEDIADLEHTVLAHIGRTVFNFDTLLQLADSGCYLEYDMFGEESSWYPFDLNVDIPNDAIRVNILKRLVDEGYLNQILISHDIAVKINLAQYGGDGFAHILKHVVPIMRLKGFSEEQIQTIIVENPKRWLKFR